MNRSHFKLTRMSFGDKGMAFEYELEGGSRGLVQWDANLLEPDRELRGLFYDSHFWIYATGGYVPMAQLAREFGYAPASFDSDFWDGQRSVRSVDLSKLGEVQVTEISIDNEVCAVQFKYEYKALPWAGTERRRSAKVMFSEEGASKRKVGFFPYWEQLFEYVTALEDRAFEVAIIDLRMKKDLGRQLSIDKIKLDMEVEHLMSDHLHSVSQEMEDAIGAEMAE